MPKLIDTAGQLLDNPWQLMAKDCSAEAVLATDASHVLVNAALWLEHQDVFAASGKSFALWLDSDQRPAMVAAELPKFTVLALNFPGFKDGRAYSTAVLLRQQLGYTGELRAIGDVLRDQLFLMKRCGFSTFDLKDSVPADSAAAALHDFSNSYQSNVIEPLPLFRRRGQLTQ